MLPLLLNKIIQTDKLLFLHLVTQKNRIYTFLNPVSYLIALENKSLFEQFDGIFADGSLLVSAIRLVYGKRVTRRSFDMTSLAPELLNYLMESRKTLYIVASGQEQVECSVKIFQEQYPGLRIAGFRNGYFSSDAEMNKEASHIVELNPDFLIVGMGALMQEKFLLKVKKMGYQGIGFTCGGFVHQTAMNRMHYYPDVSFIECIKRNIHVQDICKLHSCFRYALSGKEFSDERADFAYCHVNNGEWQQQDEDSSRNNFSEYF